MCQIMVIITKGETLEYKAFKKVVKDSIETGLSVLGEGPKNAIITHFLKRNNLKSLEEVAEYPREFEEFLKSVFGLGAPYLIKTIVKKMYESIGIDYISTETGFVESVSEIKKMIQPTKKL
ncbi:MAG: hypothetical protein N3F64_02170 [Nitrososphaeria archaeon]|nr:hypothetical protein [Nitrososphaeria archaeon]